MLELQSGQKIRLNFNTSYRNDVGISCVIKWFENDRVCIVFPAKKREFIKDLPEGKELEVILYTNSGIFVFESIVINSPLEHDFIIELPIEQTKIQRRDYIRASININLTLSRDDIEYKTRTINVGGGGIRFIAQDKLKINELWKFHLFIPDEKDIQGLGKILYTLAQGKNVTSVIIFTDISETNRNRLIKLCLDEEIKSLKIQRQS